MKWRTRLELGWNSLFPSRRSRWRDCLTKLDDAQKAIEVMESTSNRVSFEDAWSQFVDSLEESWTSFFDEGKVVSSKFQPWAGAVIKARKEDELLRYVYVSRHRSQHGRLHLNWTEQRVQFAPGFTGHIAEIKGYSDGAIEFDAEPQQAGGEKDLRVVLEGGKPELPEIENSGVVHSPPSEHQGQSITSASPLDVARLGIDYYRSIYQEADDKFRSEGN